MTYALVGLLVGQTAALFLVARRLHALEQELLGVYMEVADRLGLDGSDRTPRLRNALQVLRALRGKG